MDPLLARSPFTWDSDDEPTVRYVIIGNGFDLECGLYTSYRHFLDFIRNRGYTDQPSNTARKHSFDYSDWESLRKNNYWFRRFNSIQIGSGWIDFENEIARVVTTIERSMVNSDGWHAFIDDNVRWSPEHNNDYILTDIFDHLSVSGTAIQTYRELVKKLLYDLESLTKAFEAYLYKTVHMSSMEETDATKGLVARIVTSNQAYVISFNYTKTLERLLINHTDCCEFCYVHGAIGDGKSKNQMVLGINEHQGADSLESPIEFGPFRKYNQRIFKQTDSKYMDWIKKACEPYEISRQLKQLEDQTLTSSYDKQTIDRITNYTVSEREKQRQRMLPMEVIIFGHSLGITDEDILKSFITLPNTRTLVYYHSEEAFSQQVSNITAILGKEEVIARTGGRDRTLEFRDQREPSSWSI